MLKLQTALTAVFILAWLTAGNTVETKAIQAASDTLSDLRIVLDAGHGGYDPGIISGDIREKDVTLSVVREIEAALVKKKKTASLVRKSDQFLSITDRALFANRKSPDIFISIHLSSSDAFVIYTSVMESDNSSLPVNKIYSIMYRQRGYTVKSKALTDGVGNAIKHEFKTDAVYRAMSLPLLNSIGAAAIMIELPDAAVRDAASRAKLVEAVLKGIISYAGR